MRIISFIILISIMVMGYVSAQSNEVFLPRISDEPSQPRRLRFSVSGAGASENPTSSQSSAFVLSSELSQSIGYLAIGGALLGFYFLINKSRPKAKEIISKKS